MSIVDKNTVDFIGVGDKIVDLMIFDYLEWSSELNDREHILALQDKVGTYLDFVESGEIYEVKEETRGKDLRIRIVSLNPINENGRQVMLKLAEILSKEKISLDFVWRVDRYFHLMQKDKE